MEVEGEGAHLEPTIVTDNASTSTCGKGQRPQGSVDVRSQGVKFDNVTDNAMTSAREAVKLDTVMGNAPTSACGKAQNHSGSDVRSQGTELDNVTDNAMISACGLDTAPNEVQRQELRRKGHELVKAYFRLRSHRD